VDRLGLGWAAHWADFVTEKGKEEAMTDRAETGRWARIRKGCIISFQILFQGFEFKNQGFKYFQIKFELESN
jgi:hypothetical protein